MMEDKGVTVTERISKNLDVFQEQTEKSAIGHLVDGVIQRMQDKRQLLQTESKTRFDLIE